MLFLKIVSFSYIRTDLLHRYHFLVFVPIYCICTVFLYSYWSLVLVPFFCIVLFNSWYLLCYHL